MREQSVISQLESHLLSMNRWYLNVHSSHYGVDGNPDIITIDDNGQLLAIEAKNFGKMPKVNQWRRMIEILISGGRCVVAYPDVDVAAVLGGSFARKTVVGNVVGESEFEAQLSSPNKTSEIILESLK